MNNSTPAHTRTSFTPLADIWLKAKHSRDTATHTQTTKKQRIQKRLSRLSSIASSIHSEVDSLKAEIAELEEFIFSCDESMQLSQLDMFNVLGGAG